MKYRLYIDEVGNQDLNSADNPNERFLCLTGIIIDIGYVASFLKPELSALKREFFDIDPDEPIILHRKEIINCKYPFHILRERDTRRKFDKRLLNLLGKTKFIVISVVIDKFEHRERYRVWKYEPYHYCLAILAERYFYFLKENKAVGDVMAESRGGKEDMKLKDSFHRLYTDGTEYLKALSIQEYFTSKRLKVKPKNANVSGLQIADLIAYPCREKILEENDLLIEKPIAPFSEKVLDVIDDKFYRHPQTGKVMGYGWKLLP
ncbi:MAG: DUF3800 domain-containing protein [bacterium]